MSKSKMKSRQILKQLKADLIGKDSYRGVTFTYSWLANQFGHYSLGYIPTLVVFSIIKKYTEWTIPEFWAALIISISWCAFELYNFLGPLLLNKVSTSRMMYIPSKSKYIFQPAWGNVAFDTFTDLLFFGFGAFSAALFIHPSMRVIWTLLVLFGLFLYPSYYWFVTKMFLQYAKFPLQIRLSQWERQSRTPFTEQDIQAVLCFLERAESSAGHHLLICGGRRSGRSTLSIGIGTELSVKRCASSYYTATKLLNLFSLNEDEIIKSENCDLWSWRTASLLVIDDINPGNPIPRVFFSASDFLNAIKMPVGGRNNRNQQDLKNKNVVWVLGDEPGDNISDWQKMLVAIGVPEKQITTIGLGFGII